MVLYMVFNGKINERLINGESDVNYELRIKKKSFGA